MAISIASLRVSRAFLEKLEFFFLFLTIFSPLILSFAEPFTYFFNDKVFQTFSSIQSYLGPFLFLPFCLLALLNSFLGFKKTPPGHFKQGLSSKFLLVIFWLLLYLFSFKFQQQTKNSDWVLLALSLLYFSLFLYLILAYLGSFLLWLKRKPSQALTVFATIIIFSWLVFTVNNMLLYQKIKDLGWSNTDSNSKIDEFNDVIDTLWNERAFQKELSENLSYYLPDGFNQKAQFLSLTPLTLEGSEVRVRFLYADRVYNVDFAYTFVSVERGWNVEDLSSVTLEN